MKRTPLAIVTDLLVALNTLIPNNEYTINSIATISNLHWESTERYLEIMQIIQEFSPSICVTGNNKLKLITRNPNVPLDADELILVYCLQNKALTEESAITPPPNMDPEIEFLIEKEFGKATEGKFFLTQKGKMMAIDIFLEIQENIETFASRDPDCLDNKDLTKLLEYIKRPMVLEAFADDLIAVIVDKLEKKKDQFEVH